MTDKMPIVYWLRRDLRLADNQALAYAAAIGPVLPLFIYDDRAPEGPGGAARWWLHQALSDLGQSFRRRGAELILRRGKPETILPALLEETGIKHIVWCRGYEPALRRQDDAIRAVLEKTGIAVTITRGYLLHEPEAIHKNGGGPYRVYTPFAQACRAAMPTVPPLPAPEKLAGVKGIAGDRLEDWRLVPKTAAWPQELAQAWQPTEDAAHRHLHDFVVEKLAHYKQGRDFPARDATSRLSPYLHFGQIGPRAVWHAVDRALHRHGATAADAERYQLEILWREFSCHLLFHFPQMASEPLDPSFKKFPWRDDAKSLQAWQKGATGYPIVDAGMRQLWRTGWMHNRVRMIVASFLSKHLLIDWRAGMDWFWDTLVDADIGNNVAGWQWVAGCGADAAPYFRIFNPVLQGKKFDADGAYVRRFVPELAKLDSAYIHEPWTAPPAALAEAGLKLGQNYPLPIVDHARARKRALEAFARTRQGSGQTPVKPDLFS